MSHIERLPGIKGIISVGQGAETLLYSVTQKPNRWSFVNIEKVNKKYQFLMVRFSKVVHPTRYSEI